MVSSLARFKHILKPPFPEGVKCTYTEKEHKVDENFPVFTKDLYISVFKPAIFKRQPEDAREMDHSELMKPLDHLSTGRMGKTYTAMKKDLVKYAAGAAQKPNLTQIVAVTKMAANHVDYIDAVRYVELFNLLSRSLSPFIIKVMLSFRSRLPYQSENMFLVSEYWVTCSSYCKRLSEVGRFTESDARYYCMQLADAIMSLHEHGKIIRRLCLCNCLLEPNGFLRYSPYTLCEHNLDCGQPCNMLVRNCGDQFYSSPEVVFGVDVQQAADWWAYGVVVYQMVTGELPFTGRSLGELGKAITETDPCIPNTVSPEACALIKHLLHKDPRRRLGWGEKGHKDIKGHPWYAGQVWADVRDINNLPPYRPLDDDKAFLPQKRGERKRDVNPLRDVKSQVRDSCIKPKRPAIQ